MKRIVLLVVLAMAGAAWAQAPAPKKEAAKPAATKEAAKPDAQKPAAMAKKSRRSEDARHCLERGNNTEIIKCAEAYL